MTKVPFIHDCGCGGAQTEDIRLAASLRALSELGSILRKQWSVAHALLLVVAITSVNPVFADSHRYAGREDLVSGTTSLTVRHRHDWSKLPRHLELSPNNPFGVETNVSSLEFFVAGRSVAKIPSPPLTYLHVTPDLRYVVGLSRIKASNDTQLVVFDRNARLLHQRHISAEVFAVSKEAYQRLRFLYAHTFADLDKYSQVARNPYAWREGDIIYLDIWYATAGPGWNALMEDLYPDRRASPYSPNFGESTANFVFWYDENDPTPRIVERAGQPELIKLRDPKGIEISIPFQLTPPPNTGDVPGPNR